MDPLAKVQLVESLVQVLDSSGVLAPSEVRTVCTKWVLPTQSGCCLQCAQSGCCLLLVVVGLSNLCLLM